VAIQRYKYYLIIFCKL